MGGSKVRYFRCNECIRSFEIFLPITYKDFARYYYEFLFFSGKWPFGIDKKWLCQLAQSCKDVPVFLSSMTIVAIGKKSLKNIWMKPIISRDTKSNQYCIMP